MQFQWSQSLGISAVLHTLFSIAKICIVIYSTAVITISFQAAKYQNNTFCVEPIFFHFLFHFARNVADVVAFRLFLKTVNSLYTLSMRNSYMHNENKQTTTSVGHSKTANKLKILLCQHWMLWIPFVYHKHTHTLTLNEPSRLIEWQSKNRVETNGRVGWTQNDRTDKQAIASETTHFFRINSYMWICIHIYKRNTEEAL